MAAVARDRRSADLARLNYIPDTAFDVTWIDTTTAGMSGIGNGRDAFLVGVNVNVPIYHRRIEAGIREAETKAVATARQYDALKDQTLMEVKDLFVRATSQESTPPLSARSRVSGSGPVPASTCRCQQVFHAWKRLLGGKFET